MAGGDKESGESSPARRLKTRRTLWIAAILFVSAWTFFLGVLVGRGVAPLHYDIEELKKQLAQAKASLLESEIKQFKIPAKSQEAPADFSFYDALRESRKKPAVKKETPEVPKTQAPQKPPLPESKTEPRALTTPGMENGKKDAGVSGTTMNNSTNGSEKRMTLQVASLPNQNDARKLAEDLKKKGYPAYFEGIMIPDKGVWYRVRIGLFSSREEASVMLENLKKERLQPIIVNRNSQ